jgi:hypothetical protein
VKHSISAFVAAGGRKQNRYWKLRKWKVTDSCDHLNRIGFAECGPVAAVVFGQPVNADYTVVGGKFVVKEGQLCTVEEGKLIEKHNRAAKRLLEG